MQAMLDKIFEYISHLKKEYVILQESYFQLKGKSGFGEVEEDKSRKIIDSLEKENKYITEQIKRLSEEKIKVEKKASEHEKTIKKLE